MAEVKSLTVHGETYDIKDEAARNSINTLNESVSTLQTHDTQHTEQIATLQSSVSNNTDDINTLQENLGSVTSRVTAAEGNISTLTTQMTTKITGEWFFNNIIPQTDIGIQMTPDYTTLDLGSAYLSPGYYLVNVVNVALQNGTGNHEIAVFIGNTPTVLGTVPANENIHYAQGTGIVSIPGGNTNVRVGVRGTHDANGVIKPFSGIYITLVKVKNL